MMILNENLGILKQNLRISILKQNYTKKCVLIQTVDNSCYSEFVD